MLQKQKKWNTQKFLKKFDKTYILQKTHKQVIYFNKGYYSMENYLMEINEYNIVHVIFSRQYFRIEKLEARMSSRLDIFYNKKKLKQEKELFLELTTTLYKKLKNWKKIKPIRGLIEDFFKVCKDANNKSYLKI